MKTIRSRLLGHEVLGKALVAMSAALNSRMVSKSPPKIHDHNGDDAPEDHEDNTFGLPDGAAIRKKLKAFFALQARHVLGEVRSIGVKIPDSFPPLSDYDDPMASAMTPILSAYWDRAGSQVREKLGLDPDEWRVVDKNTHKKIRQAALNFCESTNKTTSLELNAALEALRAELLAGVVDQGESVAQLTKRVKSVFTKASTSRARRIAATEASRAVHSAALESAHQSGVVQGKRWLLSSNACPLCHTLAASSASIGLGEAFGKVGSNPAYSEVQCPPGHPGCRCTTVFVLSPEYDGSKTDATELDLNEAEIPAFEPKPKPEVSTKPRKPGKTPPADGPAITPIPPVPAPAAASKPPTMLSDLGRLYTAQEADDLKEITVPEWGKPRWKDWAESLTEEETKSLLRYKGAAYTYINADVRAGKISIRTARELPPLDSALAKAAAPEPVVVYRGIGGAGKLGLKGDQAVGVKLVDPGYASTTVLADVARTFSASVDKDTAILRFTVPRGFPAAFLDASGPLSRMSGGEGEILLPRGCAFEVSKVSRINGRTVYDCLLGRPADEAQ